MGVVGVRMGHQHAVEPIDVGVEQLLAQVGRGVDQHLRLAACRRARSTSTEQRRRRLRGFVGIAGAPALRDARHAAGGAAAEDGQRKAQGVTSSARHFGEQPQRIGARRGGDRVLVDAL